MNLQISIVCAWGEAFASQFFTDQSEGCGGTAEWCCLCCLHSVCPPPFHSPEQQLMPRISAAAAAAIRVYCRRNKRMTQTLNRGQIVTNYYSLLNYGLVQSSMFSFASIQKLIVSWLCGNKEREKKAELQCERNGGCLYIYTPHCF